jgi:succinoglycan biosynthesis protein ExoM
MPKSVVKTVTITVCLCTYKRPELLKRALEEIGKQDTKGLLEYSIVVVDNDILQSAEPVVSAFREVSSIKVIFCVEPNQNISLARNKALENARGDYVAFLDDDEFPARKWLATLLEACEEYKADGVLGPVRPHFEQPPPRWITRGRFCERPEHPTGCLLHWRQTRTGNVLFKREILEGVKIPFAPEFGNGGEDMDFFKRMIQRGHRFIWCNEAVVYEVVPPNRWKRSYMLRRALLRGQNERLFLDPISVAKSILAVIIYVMVLPFLFIAGQHLFMAYAIRLSDHVGKLLASIGLRPIGNKSLNG